MKDEYVFLKENRDKISYVSETNIRKLGAFWDMIHENILENLLINEKKEKSISQDSNQIEQKYAGFRETLDEIDGLLSIIRLTSNNEKKVFGNIRALSILRNINENNTRNVANALQKDYSEHNKKLLNALKKLETIIKTNQATPFTYKNYKSHNRLNRMYNYHCYEGLKIELRDVVKKYNPTLKKESPNLNDFINLIIQEGKEIDLRCYAKPLIIQPNEDIFMGKITVNYGDEENKLIKYMSTCNNERIKEEIKNYLELYKKQYIYDRVIVELNIVVSNLPKANLKNTIKELDNLKQTLEQNINTIKPKLTRTHELIITLIEKEKYTNLQNEKVNDSNEKIDYKKIDSRPIGSKNEVLKKFNTKYNYEIFSKKTKSLSSHEEDIAIKADITNLDARIIQDFCNIYDAFEYQLSSLINDKKIMSQRELEKKINNLVDSYTFLGLGYSLINYCIEKEKINKYIKLVDNDVIAMDFYKYNRILHSLRLNRASLDKIKEYNKKIASLNNKNIVKNLYSSVEKEGLSQYKSLCEEYYNTIYSMIKDGKGKSMDYESIKNRMIDLVVEYDLDDSLMKQVEKQVKSKVAKRNQVIDKNKKLVK